MKITRMFLLVLFVLLSLPCAYAQDKPAPEATASKPEPVALQIPVKIQMVLTEYDGAKVISSMPYAMRIIVSQNGKRDSLGQIRIGVRVPVATQETDGKGTQYNYIDIGTNIDCWVWKWSDDKFLLSGTINESSLYTMASATELVEKGWKPGDPIFAHNPIIRNTNGDFAVPLRDGQTGEATVSTDPITGHVFKVEATLTVVK